MEGLKSADQAPAGEGGREHLRGAVALGNRGDPTAHGSNEKAAAFIERAERAVDIFVHASLSIGALAAGAGCGSKRQFLSDLAKSHGDVKLGVVAANDYH
ncbi:hypothetical protein [Novosphingobium sp. MBES04]|uniref:hypothetical protein n=1 Tax=Novosphingobium sp. MBES04 TaxID=1206458 RepID=UPI001F55F79F|nr:hypothetical protein [Novosphingobium sp. MBES04]